MDRKRLKLLPFSLFVLLVASLTPVLHACDYCPIPSQTFLLKPSSTASLVLKGQSSDIQRSPWCSFNIALALLGFEQGILEDTQIPHLSFQGHEETLPENWQGKHTPLSWMENSVLWYSKHVGDAVGPERLADFVQQTGYGNTLTCEQGGADTPYCWLGAPLAISSDQQLDFIQAVASHTLPFSDRTYALTEALLYRGELAQGWSLYGKGGYGQQCIAQEPAERGLYNGWFIGWIQKDETRIPFVSEIENYLLDEGLTLARDVAVEQLNHWIQSNA